jgi:hypothetical protein
VAGNRQCASTRFDQTDFEDSSAKRAAARKILSAARRHDIEVDDGSDVAKAAKGQTAG